jgi:hypothetical protein
MEVNILSTLTTFKNVHLQMNKNILLLFSTRLMASFPFLCNSDGCGTLSSKYNTDTARIYNAWWFEAIMVFCD